MNQSQIHPALRQNSLSSPSQPKSTSYSDGTAPPAYSPIQPSPNGSYQNISTPNYYSSNQHVQDSPDNQSPSGNPNDPNDLKRPRACEACRQLKVKCEPDDSNPTGSCKRCAKANRQCIVTVPSRKRQKKTDSRVAELEKKIDALTASLAARGGSEPDVALDPAIAEQQAQHAQSVYEQWQPHTQSQNIHGQPHGVPDQPPPHPGQIAGIKRKSPQDLDYFGGELSKSAAKFKSVPPVPHFHAAYNEPRQRQDLDEMPYVDVIDRSVIDAKTAYKCFDRYTTDMCRQLPIVVFPPHIKAEEIRKTKPILFLAILGVGSSTIRPDLQSKLISEATRILADRIVYSGEKSMELVQTIQVLTVFYQPPEKYEELNFNQLIHIAAVMALDIGMGKRSKKSPYAMWKGYMDKSKPMPDPGAAETRRCWLGCYYMCSNSAMSLRRPLLIRWSLYTDECLQILATAKDAMPSDKWLCHLVKAQHIGESIGVEFSMDDPASVLSLTDPKTQRHLKAFEQDLADWREAGGEMMHNPIMKHTEAIVNLYMHEIAMHHNHNIDDFRPPYNTTPIEGPPNPDLVTHAHIESLTECLRSAHNAFEAFLSMDIKLLRALPTHFFVRNSYAAVALIKLYSAVAAKGSKFGDIFKTEQLKVDQYLDRLIQTLNKVSEDGLSRVAYKFTLIFTMLRNWHLKRTESPNNNNTNNNNNDNNNTNNNGGPRERSQHIHASRGDSGLRTAPMQHGTNIYHPWASQNRGPMDPNPQSQPRTGLQMLSDAAMGPGRPIPPQAQQGQWISPQHPIGQMQAMPSMDGMVPQPDFNAMNQAYGVAADQMANGGFTSDDFMAFGLGDEWMNLGFNPGDGSGLW